MKKINTLKIIILVIISIFLCNCSKKENIPRDIEINNFVWKGMNAYYKWQSKVPYLSDDYFSSRDKLNNYLSGFNSPKDLFESLRYQYGIVDRFSWIVDDYVALENSFEGVRFETGMNFKLYRYKNNPKNLYGYVFYVVKNSSADKKNIKRGMSFNKVNGEFLTEDNYKKLLDNNSLTITLSDYNNGNPTETNKVIELTKTQVQENPVKIAKIITQGSKKIGYLMYNQFSSNYDKDLNNAFANFNTGGITDLIVDLRYNGGGSVRTAIYLGSMITGQFTGQLYSKQIWNEKVMKSVNNKYFLDYFTNEIDNGIIKEPINSVKMEKVYFIVSEETASASELVINSLKAYINVKLVGSKTLGKHVGSITLYDSDNFMKNGDNFKTNHHWAMQPIVLEITNKNGENKPNGYVPEIEMYEDKNNLGVLGDVNEPLLARTLQYVSSGNKASNRTEFKIKEKEIWNSSMDKPDYNTMYVDFK